jgi:hypothetical protein
MEKVREERWALIIAFTAIAVIFAMAVATLPGTAEEEKPSSVRQSDSSGHIQAIEAESLSSSSWREGGEKALHQSCGELKHFNRTVPG